MFGEVARDHAFDGDDRDLHRAIGDARFPCQEPRQGKGEEEEGGKHEDCTHQAPQDGAAPSPHRFSPQQSGLAAAHAGRQAAQLAYTRSSTSVGFPSPSW